MATPLYARYDPPKKNSEFVPKLNRDESRKRKRKLEETDRQLSVETPTGGTQAEGEIEKKTHLHEKERHNYKSRDRKDDEKHSKTKHNGKTHRTNSEGDYLENNEVLEQHRESKVPNIQSKQSQSRVGPIKELEPKRSKRRRKESNGPQASNEDDVDLEEQSKHSVLYSKFKKSMEGQPTERPPETSPQDEPESVHDLVPIPIPKQPDEVDGPKSFSALPSWISKPILVPANSRLPFSDLQLTPELIDRLQKNGFHTALPIQCGLLPRLLPLETQHPGDLCVSAHTGSGKTLAYVLPIIQGLPDDVITHLRALIIVPTRELVEQVRQTVEMCSDGTNFCIGTAVGSTPLGEEQSKLIRKTQRYDPAAYEKFKKGHPIAGGLQSGDSDGDSDDLDLSMTAQEFLNLAPKFVPHYESRVDILIATPGRLVEHMKQTRGFSLKDIKWLIIDEADRLLDASFQEWAEILMTALEKSPSEQSIFPGVQDFAIFPWPHKIRKVVLSATMTRDLDKLGELKLFSPRMIGIEGAENKQIRDKTGFTELPSTLNQFGVPTGDGSQKPLYLLILLKQVLESQSVRSTSFSDSSGPSKRNQKDNTSDSEDDEATSESSVENASDTTSTSSSAPESLETENAQKSNQLDSNVLVFTSSTEAAHRLARLITLLNPSYSSILSTITKSNASKRTRKTLSSFRDSKVRILVATERASRGLDLPNLENVVNYDIPHNVTSYIHRVGRTARAEREGSAWTLIEDRQAAWFWKSLAKIEHIRQINGGIVRKNLDLSVLSSIVRDRYTTALSELERDVKRGRH